jgi:VWFA-related protein
MGLIVTDGANRSVANVRKENIQITADGQPVAVSFFGKDERPLRCVVAIDASGSFKEKIGAGVNVTRLIIETKKPDDETMLMSFVSSDKMDVLAEFTPDGATILAALKKVGWEAGQSAVIDAVYLAVDAAAKRQMANPGVRSVVVLVTDGEDRGSYFKLAYLEKLLRETDVQIFTIGFTRELNKASGGRSSLNVREKAENLLLKLAQETGGRTFLVETEAELIEAIKQVLVDLNSQYLIGFDRQPQPAEHGVRPIKVTIVNDPQAKDLRAITRPGYRVGPPEPGRTDKVK